MSEFRLDDAGLFLDRQLESLDVVLQRIDASRRENTRLAHGATESMFPTPCLLNKVCPASQHAPDGTTQSLGKIQPNAVEGCSELGGRRSTGNHCIHQTRPIHV